MGGIVQMHDNYQIRFQMHLLLGSSYHGNNSTGQGQGISTPALHQQKWSTLFVVIPNLEIHCSLWGVKFQWSCMWIIQLKCQQKVWLLLIYKETTYCSGVLVRTFRCGPGNCKLWRGFQGGFNCNLRGKHMHGTLQREGWLFKRL